MMFAPRGGDGVVCMGCQMYLVGVKVCHVSGCNHQWHYVNGQYVVTSVCGWSVLEGVGNGHGSNNNYYRCTPREATWDMAIVS